MNFRSAVIAVVGALGAAGLGVGAYLGFAEHSAPLPAQTYSPADPSSYTGPQSASGSSLEGASLHIPSIGVDVPLVTAGERDGQMVVPDPPLVAWYDQSAPIGSGAGMSVLAGHVDDRSGDLTALGRLHEVDKGAPLVVSDPAGNQRQYVVSEMTTYQMGDIPPDVLSTSGREGLRIITCAGRLLGQPGTFAYEKNLVVTAVPAPGPGEANT